MHVLRCDKQVRLGWSALSVSGDRPGLQAWRELEERKVPVERLDQMECQAVRVILVK